jgi:membrane protease YdiL (CAAX protease family)
MRVAESRFTIRSHPGPEALPGASPAPDPDRFPLVASTAHTIRFVGGLMVFATLLALRTAQAAQGAPGSHVPEYLTLIGFEWLLFVFARAGLKRRGTSIRAIIGGRWRSARDLFVTLILAAGFWIVAHFALDGLKWALSAIGQSPLDEGRRTQALVEPHGAIESILWIALCLSAGFCEEFVFRGYLQRQLTALTRRPAAGIVAAALVFGIGHAYQGWRSVAVISIYGVFFGLLAHFSRSLRPGMMAHAWQDIYAGLIDR